MKKFIVTLSVATVAALFVADGASAGSYHSYLARHPGIASRAALRNSPHVRQLLREQSAVTHNAAVSTDGMIEYGSAFAAPETSGSNTVTVHRSAPRYSVFTKPGNRRHWLR